MKDFAAIDFETANEQPCSVCSVGVVIVRGGQIVDSFYSLIHPEPEYYQWFCRQVHGLGPEDTEDALVFPFVWAKIEPLIEGLPNHQLQTVAAACGYELTNHHHALADAEACAYIAMSIL